MPKEEQTSAVSAPVSAAIGNEMGEENKRDKRARGKRIRAARRRRSEYSRLVGDIALNSRIPSALGWLTALAGLVSLLHFFFSRLGNSHFFHYIVAIFQALNIPATANLFVGVMLLLYSSLALRRKLAAVVIGVSFQALLLAAMLLIFLFDYLEPGLLTTSEIVATIVGSVVSLIWIVLLVSVRKDFPGRVQNGSWWPAAIVLFGGLAFVFAVGMGIISKLRVWTSPRSDASWVLYYMFGRDSLALFGSTRRGYGPVWLEFVLGFATVIVACIAVLTFFRGRSQSVRTMDEDIALRKLLAEFPNDSLGYFAERADRSVVFNEDQTAAVSYGVSNGVAVAAGDPLGNPERWDEAIGQFLLVCYKYGWVPSVISASEKGAEAYRRFGMGVREMGDEAILQTAIFSSSNPRLRELYRTVRKARRAGSEITVVRASELDEAEQTEVIDTCNRLRVGEERGFSMALDRAVSPIDPDIVVVRSRAENGQLEAVLTFVPWGKRGVSLNYMRRSKDSVNGIVEAMVMELVEYGQRSGIDQISLNFAMFRKVFVDAENVGATLKQRFQQRIMQLASKVWQLESLYQSNARYDPHWYTRYFCFINSPWFFQSFMASGVLEGFVPTPRWLKRATQLPYANDPQYLQRIEAIDRELIMHKLTRKVSQQTAVRMHKADALRAAGMEPYPTGIPQGCTVAQALAQDANVPDAPELTLSARIRSIRNYGGLRFVDVTDESGTLQVILSRDKTEQFDLLRYTDIGDAIVVRGTRGLSHTGMESFYARQWWMAAKSLHPINYARCVDGKVVIPAAASTRTQLFLTDPAALKVLQQRFAAMHAIRSCLDGQGFTEVETPMLHAVQGGANARPFKTHYTAYDTTAFLRIAPELYLKRLAVAGMEAIYEMGRSFRNEGADQTHNPEFTSLEAYRAGGDYNTMRQLTVEIIRAAATAIHGRPVALRPLDTLQSPQAIAAVKEGKLATAGNHRIHLRDGREYIEVDLGGEWPVVPVYTAVSQACGQTITPDTTEDELLQLCGKYNLEVPVTADHGYLIGELYDELVEGHTIAPTFYTDFPVSTSPLTRKHRVDPRLAERWDLVAFGMEIGTAYTELTDPIDQRERFTAQSLAAAAGDPEAMSLDNDFLAALECGLVPTGGLGLGVDRIVMMLLGVNIRQTLAFPFVKPESEK